MTHRRRLRLGLWLALWAVLIQAAFPAFVRATTGPSQLAEVCSAQGVKQVAVAADGNILPDHANGAAHDQCPCCVGGCGVPALSFPRGLAAAGPGPARAPPAWQAQRPDPLLHWFSLLERGPPAVS